MHAIFFNTKGGVAKSTLCEFTARELQRLNYTVAIDNTDQQQHVNIIDNDDAQFTLYDTAGAFTVSNVKLLQAAAGAESMVIVPLGTGHNDVQEIDFVVSKLTEYALIERTYFVFTRTRSTSKALNERRLLLESKGLNVCRWVMPNLEDFSEKRDTARTRNEISAFLHEVIL